ncbi:tryptophan-rich sensory protein [Hymenobacter metallilatus]|uniref:Tryptophan-rich sensory protein n=1 Tax=Hymenobacter metallilatus TaxID=2493666 RepID=A0A3R9MXS4_9BACT|nr:tryptophan-rich sensory protein [Hymenobacter metallilatus]RSK33086.1 hypothetical protein EI290_10240 [Hymenobacter metallilatus]
MTTNLGFLAALNQPTRRGLLLNVGAAVLSCLLLNGLIFAFNWDDSGPLPLAPALGPYVGAVWVGLFALLGTARWQLIRVGSSAGRRARRWVVILMASCLAYPFYTLALGSDLAGLLGNVETILLAAFVAWRIWPYSRPAARLVLPVIAWVTFATATVLRGLGWL